MPRTSVWPNRNGLVVAQLPQRGEGVRFHALRCDRRRCSASANTSRKACTTSSPPMPRMPTPRTFLLSASTSTFMKPCVSPRFNADKTGRLLRKERQNLAAPQLTAHNRSTRPINARHLKHVLREIKPDRGNFVHGRLPFGGSSTATAFWHLDAGGGSRPQHQEQTFVANTCPCFLGVCLSLLQTPR